MCQIFDSHRVYVVIAVDVVGVVVDVVHDDCAVDFFAFHFAAVAAHAFDLLVDFDNPLFVAAVVAADAVVVRQLEIDFAEQSYVVLPLFSFVVLL